MANAAEPIMAPSLLFPNSLIHLNAAPPPRMQLAGTIRAPAFAARAASGTFGTTLSETMSGEAPMDMLEAAHKPAPGAARISERLIAIRDRWHCKNHPFYADLAAGRLELRHLGAFLVQHYLVVREIFRSVGIAYAKAPDDIARNIVENLAEEAGLLGIHNHKAKNHTDLILAFTRHCGIADEAVKGGELLPTWLARAALFRWITDSESAAIRIAVQASTESQLVGENAQIVMPALVKHYGFKPDDPLIGFFAEHAFADVKHGDEMYALVNRHVVTEDERHRAVKWVERMCRLRWASFNEIYRETVEGVSLESTLRR